MYVKYVSLGSPVFSCKTKVGRDNSGRAELPRTGPIKTKPINWILKDEHFVDYDNIFIQNKVAHTSGGIPNVSPTTVVNQTFRKSRPENEHR